MSSIPTLVAGLLGGALFSFLSLPLPWMLGAIFGVILVSRFTATITRPLRQMLDPARVVLGLAIGAQFSASMIDNLGAYALSLIFLLPFVAITGFVGWLYFKRFAGLDNRTAFLCAMPGGIAELILVGEDIGADIRKVALVQGIRVLVLVYSLPFITGYLTGTDVGGNRRVMPTILESDAGAIAMLSAIGLAGWFIFKRLGLSGAPIIGPMIFAAGLSIAGLLPQSPPDELFKAAQWILGSSIGGVFIGYSLKKMAETTLSSLGYFLLLAIVTLATAGIVHSLTDFTFVSALLAFAPGGQAETSLISLILGENTSYVALHHLVRLILLVSLIPILARRVFR